MSRRHNHNHFHFLWRRNAASEVADNAALKYTGMTVGTGVGKRLHTRYLLNQHSVNSRVLAARGRPIKMFYKKRPLSLQSVQVWVNGCTRYLLNQHSVNPKVLAARGRPIKKKNIYIYIYKKRPLSLQSVWVWVNGCTHATYSTDIRWTREF